MKRLISLMFVMGILMLSVISIKAESIELKSIDTILAEIRQDQNLFSSEPIDLSKVTYAKLEELGDSVMEKVIGNSEVHDRIDIQMGGDGSASLTRIHTRIGYDYLSGIPITMKYFMGYGSMMSYGSMIGGIAVYNQIGTTPGYVTMMSGFGWVWMLLGLVGIIALIAGLLHLTPRKPKPTEVIPPDKAIAILKERYARGEITHEDYTKMSDTLK